ncbi:MAG: phosphopantetheine-binding protein, partial [Finegoldia magna]|nr:phosphopantetheine-binding protein [Finegoldia magna]
MEINDIKNIAIQSIKEQIRMEINDDFEKDDNLIERGLSSIMIMKISNKLRKSGIRISFSKLMEKPTFNEWEMLIKSAKINDKFILKEAEIVKNKEYVGIKFPLTDVQYAYWVGREDDQVLGGVGCHAYLEIDGKDECEVTARDIT